MRRIAAGTRRRGATARREHPGTRLESIAGVIPRVSAPRVTNHVHLAGLGAEAPEQAPLPVPKMSSGIRVAPVGGAEPHAGAIEMPPHVTGRPVPDTDVGAMLARGPWATAEDPRLHEGLGAAAMPEDFSATSGQFLMDYDGAGDSARLAFIDRMAEVGRAEGFNVVVTVPSDAVAAELRAGTGGADNVVPIVGEGAPWPEDTLHFYTDGRAVVPPEHDYGAMTQPIIEGRLLRHTGSVPDDPDAAMAAFSATPELQFGGSGATVRDGTIRPSAAAVATLGGEARTATTFVEGGNIINGTRDGRPYAVVGADALARNMALLDTDEAGVRAAMAADLGVAPDDLHFVEQPADFHLDVAMTPWGDDRMLLNDARLAAAEQIRASGLDPKSPEATRLLAEAERRAVLEDRTAEELAAAGFEVTRVPGRFFEVGEDGRAIEIANFMNGEAGSNTNGENYFITQRGDRGFEDAFLAALPTDVPVRVYFAMDNVSARALLAKGGAANCTIKRLPDGWGFVPGR